jgi:hypothetical protein
MTTLRAIISTPRFEGYRLSPTDSDLLCLERYVWNIALGEALYPTLQYLEIALRNSIHNAASATFNNDFWFDMPSIISDKTTRRIISDAKSKISRVGKPVTSGRVVAGLHFGFWRALFYNQYEKTLWRPIIKDVFPYAPKNLRQRVAITPRIHQAKELRNRIFHHEPIWQWKLSDVHDELLETIGWINQPLKDLAELYDRFPQVSKMNLSDYENALKHLKI